MQLTAEAVAMCLESRQILHDVHIDVCEKECVGIIGPNGSGKSTLLKCLYRVLKPSAGRIAIDGRTLDEFSFRETALKMAVVAQHNQYSFDFSVLDVVLMGRAPHKRLLQRDTHEDYTLAREALVAVGLDGFENRFLSTLSGGEQQRVILARALAQQSECLILDEPTNHLDIKYQLEIMDIVKSLDKTIVAAIHDLNVAAMYCDRLIALQNGKVVGVGTPRELLTESFIYDLYEVQSRVRWDDELEQLHIQYRPQKRSFL